MVPSALFTSSIVMLRFYWSTFCLMLTLLLPLAYMLQNCISDFSDGHLSNRTLVVVLLVHLASSGSNSIAVRLSWATDYNEASLSLVLNDAMAPEAADFLLSTCHKLAVETTLVDFLLNALHVAFYRWILSWHSYCIQKIRNFGLYKPTVKPFFDNADQSLRLWFLIVSHFYFVGWFDRTHDTSEVAPYEMFEELSCAQRAKN